VLFSAVDHIQNVGEAEYQITQHALFLMEKADRFHSYKHLWGHRLTARALVPFLSLGASETEALKFLALAVFALLMIFPERHFLYWTLSLWGSYPEAVSLMSAAAALWAVAILRPSRWLFLVAGLALGLVTAFSISVAFVPAAAFAATSFLSISGRRRDALLFLGGGFVAGFSPFLVWMFGGGAVDTFDIGVFDNRSALPFWSIISRPDFHRLAELVGRFGEAGYFSHWVERILLLAGLGWTAFSALVFKKPLGRGWPVLFPLTFAFGALALAMFPFGEFLEIRHVLWFYPAGYFCVAMFLGDSLFPQTPVWKGVNLHRAEWILKGGLFALLLTWRIWAEVSPFVQPGEFGVLRDFRGGDYCRKQIGLILGPEVKRVNCFLDEGTGLSDGDFHRGFQAVFPLIGIQDCCLWDPFRPGLSKVRPPAGEAPRSEYFRGAGCAFGLKESGGRFAIGLIEKHFGPAASSSAKEGFETCRRLPCLSGP